jgi:hypothetical protein
MELILLFAVLVCPIAMGAMMFLMMRGMRRHGASREGVQEEKAPVSRLKTGHRES